MLVHTYVRAYNILLHVFLSAFDNVLHVLYIFQSFDDFPEHYVQSHIQCLYVLGMGGEHEDIRRKQL